MNDNPIYFYQRIAEQSEQAKRIADRDGFNLNEHRKLMRLQQLRNLDAQKMLVTDAAKRELEAAEKSAESTQS